MKKGIYSVIALIVGLILFILSFQLYLDARRTALLAPQHMPDILETPSRAEISEEIGRSRQTAITHTIEKASPAIVGVHVTREQITQSPFFSDPFFNFFFPNNRNKRRVQSLGSGVMISRDGYIVTNAHVLGENAVEVYATLTGGKRHAAEIIGVDPLTDIALLKIEGEEFACVKMGDSDDIIIGEWVIALGNPFGLFDVSDKPIATAGIISSIRMNFGETGSGHVYQDMIQTDASINSGNSGGALINMNGEFIGLNTFIFSGTQYGEGGSIGIGFAIPSNRIRQVVEELKTHGKIERGWDFGLSGQRLTQSIIDYYKLDTDHGIIILDVQKGKAGDIAGLKVGDIILSINDQEVNRLQDVIDIINTSYLKTGDKINALIHREGREFSVEIPLMK